MMFETYTKSSKSRVFMGMLSILTDIPSRDCLRTDLIELQKEKNLLLQQQAGGVTVEGADLKAGPDGVGRRKERKNYCDFTHHPTYTKLLLRRVGVASTEDKSKLLLQRLLTSEVSC